MCKMPRWERAKLKRMQTSHTRSPSDSPRWPKFQTHHRSFKLDDFKAHGSQRSDRRICKKHMHSHFPRSTAGFTSPSPRERQGGAGTPGASSHSTFLRDRHGHPQPCWPHRHRLSPRRAVLRLPRLYTRTRVCNKRTHPHTRVRARRTRRHQRSDARTQRPLYPETAGSPLCSRGAGKDTPARRPQRPVPTYRCGPRRPAPPAPAAAAPSPRTHSGGFRLPRPAAGGSAWAAPPARAAGSSAGPGPAAPGAVRRAQPALASPLRPSLRRSR